jgi:hypothetical protein
MAALNTAWDVPLAVRKALTSTELSSTALILLPEAGIYGKDCLSTR